MHGKCVQASRHQRVQGTHSCWPAASLTGSVLATWMLTTWRRLPSWSLMASLVSHMLLTWLADLLFCPVPCWFKQGSLMERQHHRDAIQLLLGAAAAGLRLQQRWVYKCTWVVPLCPLCVSACIDRNLHHAEHHQKVQAPFPPPPPPPHPPYFWVTAPALSFVSPQAPKRLLRQCLAACGNLSSLNPAKAQAAQGRRITAGTHTWLTLQAGGFRRWWTM